MLKGRIVTGIWIEVWARSSISQIYNLNTSMIKEVRVIYLSEWDRQKEWDGRDV